MRSNYKHDPQISLEEGYEVTDLNVRGIVIIGVAVLGTVAITIPLILIIMGLLLEVNESMRPEPISPLVGAVRETPQGARLQTTPVADKAGTIAQDRAHLESYGVIYESEEMSVGHIPIERAIELVARGELPYREDPVDARYQDEHADVPAAVEAPAGAAQDVP